MKVLICMRIFLFLLLILFFCEAGNENIVKAQDGSGKATTTTTNPTKPVTTTKTVTKPKPVKTVDKPSKTVTTKSKKLPDPPVADWEIDNMSGRWTGFYSEVACTLEVERIEGDTFYAKMFWGEGFEIAITGVIDRNSRKVTLTETEVLRLNPNGVWRLHVNTGTLTYNGLSMKGIGRDGKYSYKWSFNKASK